jgi:very-short-patch-repair endonuclease
VFAQVSGRAHGSASFEVGRFVADFAVPAVRLVVEVDGEYHASRAAADARRDEKLRRWGWRVVRVGAREVMRDLPAVVARVGEALRGS